MSHIWLETEILFLKSNSILTNKELAKKFNVSYDAIIKIKQAHRINKLLRKPLPNRIWKIIAEFPKYEVSDYGEVRNIKRGNILKQRNDLRGYLSLQFKIGKITFNRSVHRLVAKAFIINTYNYPQVNHKDGNKLNNCKTNLEWVTESENMQHAHDTGLIKMPTGADHWTAKKLINTK